MAHYKNVVIPSIPITCILMQMRSCKMTNWQASGTNIKALWAFEYVHIYHFNSNQGQEVRLLALFQESAWRNGFAVSKIPSALKPPGRQEEGRTAQGKQTNAAVPGNGGHSWLWDAHMQKPAGGQTYLWWYPSLRWTWPCQHSQMRCAHPWVYNFSSRCSLIK